MTCVFIWTILYFCVHDVISMTSSTGLYQMTPVSDYSPSDCVTWHSTSFTDLKRANLNCGKICNIGCCQYFSWDDTNGCIMCIYGQPLASKFVQWNGSITADPKRSLHVKSPQVDNLGMAFRALSDNSYQILSFNNWPSISKGSSNEFNVKAYTLTMRFKTSEANGILFYAENTPSTVVSKATDLIGGYIKGGFVHHIIDNYAGPGIAKTTAQYNDGLWHTAKFVKNSDNCKVCVDDVCHSAVASASGGYANVVEAFKVGGVPSTLATKASSRLTMSTGFKGCIANMTMEGSPAGSPSQEYQLILCCRL